MTAQRIFTWLAYNWEFVGIGVTLLAVGYGAVLDTRYDKTLRVIREARERRNA